MALYSSQDKDTTTLMFWFNWSFDIRIWMPSSRAQKLEESKF